MTALPDAVRGYARRLHTAIGDGHHIASPLGAWLVPALAAPAADGPEAERLAEVLGMPADEAARAARALLDAPHPAVAAAAAARTKHVPEAAAGWLAVARYHRRGFEAAAVTALAMMTSAMVQAQGRQRHALLRFDRPYAVVASIPHGPAGPWIGLPAFSAWVTEPDEATDD